MFVYKIMFTLGFCSIQETLPHPDGTGYKRNAEKKNQIFLVRYDMQLHCKSSVHLAHKNDRQMKFHCIVLL